MYVSVFWAREGGQVSMSVLNSYWCACQSLTPLLWCHICSFTAHMACDVGVLLHNVGTGWALRRSPSSLSCEITLLWKDSWGQIHKNADLQWVKNSFGAVEKTKGQENNLNDNLNQPEESYAVRMILCLQFKVWLDYQVLNKPTFPTIKVYLIYSTGSSLLRVRLILLTGQDVLQLLSSAPSLLEYKSIFST